jgi:hypothetical protein
LLEAILEPNAAIATGFETQLILDLEGVTHLGIVKAETDEYVELMDADGRLVRIPQDDIEERRRGQSSMPDGMDEKLSRYEIRDLVEYLASLSAAKPNNEHAWLSYENRGASIVQGRSNQRATVVFDDSPIVDCDFVSFVLFFLFKCC